MTLLYHCGTNKKGLGKRHLHLHMDTDKPKVNKPLQQREAGEMWGVRGNSSLAKKKTWA